MAGTTYNESNADPKTSSVAVSLFDDSVENHLNAMNTIRKLCRTTEEEEEEEEESLDTFEIERLGSSVTFIREWKQYRYTPRTVKFSCDTDDQQGKHVICEVNLPQFSAANVPKTKRMSRSPEPSTDYVLYVGGHVWALDWCPDDRQRSDCRTKCEYLAVSAHPSGSSYHKIGAPLIGRGVIQIWCVVHAVTEEELRIDPLQNTKGKLSVGKGILRKRGRPRKNRDTEESLVDLDAGNASVALSRTARSRKRARLESCDTDDGMDNSERENKTVQGTSARFCDVKEKKPLPLKKARGRPKKQKDMKESLVDLDKENATVSTFSVDTSRVSSGCLALTEATRSREHTLLESHDRVDGSDNSKVENKMVQDTAARLCDGEEKKTLPLKKARGRPRKQKGRMESLFGSDTKNKSNSSVSVDIAGLNCADTISAAQLCDGEEKKTLPLKKARGRPRKQKGRMESLFGSDTKNKSSSSVSVDIADLTEATRSTEHAPLKICGADDGLYDLSRGNQIVQETDVQLCDAKEKKSLPPKKGRGRPRKQKNTIKSLVDLDAENKSTLTLSADISQVSSGFLGSTVPTKSPDRALPIICGSNYELDDSRRGHLMVEAIQLCDVKEKKTHPLKKRRGRPRKQKDMKEALVDLDTVNESIPICSVDTSQVSFGFLTSTEAARSTNEHAPQKNCGTNDVLENSNRNQMVQATSVQPCDVKEHTSLLKKGRRKPSKQDIKKFLLALEAESESETVSTLPAEEDSREKSHDVDDRLDSGRGKKNIQATDVQVFDAKEREPLPSIKTRGRTRKQRETKEALVDLEPEKKSVPALAVDISEVPSAILASTEENVPCCDTNVGRETQTVNQRSYKKPIKRRKLKGKTKTRSHTDGTSPHLLSQDEDLDPFVYDLKGNEGYGQEGVTLFSDVANSEPLEVSTSSFELPKDVALPRVVLCLAHNGKVAWDVKWQPPTESDEEHKHRMGYLAVLLGNGSLEVWEIPSPRAIEVLYSSRKKEGTDPRFVKLVPVFRCSKLKSGDRHSIPLTVEWSRSSPHNLLLAGCHDGTVALWKFSPSGTPQDTRPLLCFSADTLPIRALAWAPDESDEESANIVATAGHGGIRFWDIRDPYRPLWEFIPVRRFIYGLDWLQDPRCVLMTYDDGTMRILSLSKFSSDVPVTGKLSDGTQQPGSQNYSCSSYAIWSIHVSRRTGQVLYCGADGSVRCFQLTKKMIDQDHSRNRAFHFLCGSLTEEDTTLTVNTPWPNIPIKISKHQANPWGDAPTSIQDVMFLNQTKRVNDQTPERDSVTFGHGDDPFGSGNISASKGKTTSKKKKIEPVPIQVDKSRKEEKWANIEVLPPKMVALHRVRWNMNRGSERWVCYGGAAGIIRCQEMSLYSTMVLPSD